MSTVLQAGPLGEVAKAVLGDAAFLFCDDVPASAGPMEGRLAEATIRFEGPTAGSITLRLPWQVAMEAAANLLGTELDDPEAEENALAAVGELLNMISGSALQRWFGASASWALGVPLTSAREGTLPSPPPRGEVVGYVIDDARIESKRVKEAPDDQGPHRRRLQRGASHQQPDPLGGAATSRWSARRPTPTWRATSSSPASPTW